MMDTRTVVALLACCVAIFGCVGASKKFTVKNCQKGPSIAKINSFKLSPDPISFSKDVSVTLEIVLNDQIPNGTLVVQNIWKLTSIFGVPIKYHMGCYSGKGSCTTEICKYMDELREQACPFFPAGAPCSCPFNAATYKGEKVRIRMPEMGSFLKWIASGEFLTEVKLVTKEKKQIACFEFQGSAIP